VSFVAGVVAAALGFVIAQRQAQPPPDPHVVEAVVPSKILGLSRDVIVSLPDDYQREATRRYSVLYVLDGSSHTDHTAESARLLARLGVIPDVIVVGLPSSDENRSLDYTPPYMRIDADSKNSPAGQADRFLRFLESELIPFVDQRYRTTSTRMLAGSSRGGLFVVYSLLEKPDLFRARFAFSPALWRDDQRVVKELAQARVNGPTFLYLSLGDAENPKMTAAFRNAVATLRTSAPAALRWRVDITRGANHGNNAALSTPVALYAYYQGSR